MSTMIVGTEPLGVVEVSGADALRAVFVPELLLDAWRDLARERGLSETELWGSFWALALEGGAQRARLLLDQVDAEVERDVVQVLDTDAWVSSVLASGFLPLRRASGMLSVVAPAPRVPLSDARQALEESLQGASL